MLSDIHDVVVLYLAATYSLSLIFSYLPPAIGIFLGLPGTLVHEILHFFTGLVLLARPTSFSIWPKKIAPGEWTLGTVSFRNLSWYNVIFVSLAPLMIIPVSIYLLLHINVGVEKYLLLGALAFLSTGAVPSKVDLMAIYNNKIAFLIISLLISYYFLKLSNAYF